MADPKLRRRGHGEDAIYFAASKNRYLGAVSLGFTPDGKRIRRKVSGKTKQEVRDKLKALHQELDAGVRSPAGYTVRRAVEDWLGEGLDGRSERTTTLYAGLLQPVLEIIGAKPLRDLTAGDVRSALGQLTSAIPPDPSRSPATHWTGLSGTPRPTISSHAMWPHWWSS
jgi:hypothetical protein